MKQDLQNSSGFLETHSVSKESLIPNVSNFELILGEIQSFSDADLKLPERLMLGKRAERYFSEWLKRSSEYELIAENIQVIDQKQTLGEFDFIVRRKSDQQLIHIELVYKFYVFDPTAIGSEFTRWIGPNRKDRLDYKVEKLTNHQFPLMFHEAAIKKLNDLKVDTSNIEQQVLFLANLFVPTNEEVNFDKVNESAVEGKWMNLSEWEEAFNTTIQFAIPPKINWFSKELKDANWLSKDQAREKIRSMHNLERSPLIYAKDGAGNQRRDFVVYW